MIHWNVDPDLIHLGAITIRWYGLCFGLALVLTHVVMHHIFKKEKIPLHYLDQLATYLAIGTIVGARLGHCLFYEPQIYLADPIRILKVWEGGLASHGALLGIIVALWLFVRRVPGSPV